MKSKWVKRLAPAVIGAMMMSMLLTGCLESAPSKQTNNTDGTEKTNSQSSDSTFGLNETAVFSNISVTATECKESSGDGLWQPDEGNVFVGVKFTVENTSDTDQTISSLLLFDAYVDGVKCAYSFSANTAFSDGTLDGTVSPGKKLVGYYGVEVPSDWQELELQVQSSWLSNAKAAFVFQAEA